MRLHTLLQSWYFMPGQRSCNDYGHCSNREATMTQWYVRHGVSNMTTCDVQLMTWHHMWRDDVSDTTTRLTLHDDVSYTAICPTWWHVRHNDISDTTPHVMFDMSCLTWWRHIWHDNMSDMTFRTHPTKCLTWWHVRHIRHKMTHLTRRLATRQKRRCSEVKRDISVTLNVYLNLYRGSILPTHIVLVLKVIRYHFARSAPCWQIVARRSATVVWRVLQCFRHAIAYDQSEIRGHVTSIGTILRFCDISHYCITVKICY